MSDKILPIEQDHPIVREAFGTFGGRIKRLGLLRLMALEGKRMGSTQICEAAGIADDIKKTARLRNVLYNCKREGLIEETKIAYNYHIYRISPLGIDALAHINDILAEYGWGLPQEILVANKNTTCATHTEPTAQKEAEDATI